MIIDVSLHRVRNIRAVANAPRVPHAAGFQVAFLRPESICGGMDPFLQVDAFALAEPVFAPHPHAGFNAVTYILPESAIGFINRDSLGTRNRIAPGALHWTMAGHGVLHEEVPELRGTAALGLQIFINLPSGMKHAAPLAIHAEPSDIPVIERDGTTIRAVIGESNGIASPVTPPTPGVRLIDVTLTEDSMFEQVLGPLDNVFLWIFAGAATAVTASGDIALYSFDLVGYQSDGDRVRLRGGPGGARLVLFAGPPLDEPIAARGPFVMATAADLDDAFARYRSGRMGMLVPTSYGPDRRPTNPG